MEQTSINWSDPKQKISKYFTVGEVTKGDPRRIPKSGSQNERNILALARELDKVRSDWNAPIVVTSWFRPVDVNRAVGGAPNSFHITGQAADIRPVLDSDLPRFQQWLEENWFGGLGRGSRMGFVHLDTRNGKGWKSGGSRPAPFNYS